MMTMLKTLDRYFALVLKYAAIACFISLFILLALGVIVRSFPVFVISGYDEIIELLFAWLTFVTTVALWREGALYRVTVIEDALPEGFSQLLKC